MIQPKVFSPLSYHQKVDAFLSRLVQFLAPSSGKLPKRNRNVSFNKENGFLKTLQY